MRLWLPLLLCLSVSVGACQEGGAPGSAAPPPVAAQVQAAFPARGLADTIVIRAVDRLALRAAELVAPDGSTTPASSLETAASPRAGSGQWATSDPWRNALSETGSAAAVPPASAGAALRSETQLLATISTAEIPLPDPVAYRRDWPQYRIRLIFGTPPASEETRELPAPEPPPG